MVRDRAPARGLLNLSGLVEMSLLRRLGPALLVAVLAVGAACGGGSGGEGGGAGGGGGQPAGSTKVSLSEFKFAPSTIEVKSGTVQLFLVNSGTTPHDMVVVDSTGKQLGKSELIQPGNSSLFKLDGVPAGTYDVFCDLPGHRESGMQGKLVAG